MTKAIWIVPAAMALTFGSGHVEPPGPAPAKKEAATVTKYGVPVKAGPMDNILVKDYRPSSSLVVPATHITRPAFPVIDAHSHSSMSRIRTKADVDAWVKTMDEVGVEVSVVFTNASGAKFDEQVELYKAYPKRFQLWYSFDTSNAGAPDFTAATVAELERV